MKSDFNIVLGSLRACLPNEVVEVRANFYNPLDEVDE